METRGLGEKKASVALLSKGALGLWFVPRGESTFPECSSLNRVLSHGFDVGSVLCSQAGSRGLLGPASRMHFLADSCISTKGNTFGVGFNLRRPPAKQQGPGSQRQPGPSLAYGDKKARGEKGKRCLLSKGELGLCFFPRGESTFPECSSQNLVLSRG